MFEFKKMETKLLAAELSKLTDENFCSIIKQIDTAQLKEIQPSCSIEKMMRIMQELQSRKSSEVSIKSASIESEKLCLPITNEEITPTPNLLLRSSLFSASKTHGSNDTAIRDFSVTTYGEKAEITLTSFRHFTQLDLDLLLELINLQQLQNQSVIKITARQLIIKTTGSDGKAQYEQIKEQLEALQNASIKIKYGRYTFVGSILSSAYFDDEEHQYVVRFNQDLQPIFSGNNWTAIDINIRKSLRTNLAKWLHGFYSSHLNSNMPIKLETIYNLSGAADKDIARWNRETIIKALENLKSNFIKSGKRFNYKIENNYLYVNKSQTISQNKSIKNKILAKPKPKKEINK